MTELIWRSGPGGVRVPDTAAMELERLAAERDAAKDARAQAEAERNKAWKNLAQFRKVARASADRADRQTARSARLEADLLNERIRTEAVERELAIFREAVAPRLRRSEPNFCGCGCLLARADEDCPNCRANLMEVAA